MMKIAAFFGKRHQENVEPKLLGRGKPKTTTATTQSRSAFADVTNKAPEASNIANDKKPLKEAKVEAIEEKKFTLPPLPPMKPVEQPVFELPVERKDLPLGVEDIDAPDEENPAFCSEYVMDVITSLREKEVAERIPPNYMAGLQHSVTPRMRNILADWMIEVINRFEMCNETTFLAINILDKYLARVEVQQRDLQLIGVAAILTASKIEDIYAVALDDLVAITGNAVAAEDVVAQERKILTAIDWCLTSPYSIHFLRRYSKAADSDGFVHTVSKFLLELAALQYGMLEYLPSMQAAAAVYLARRMCGEAELWSKTTEYYSGYSLEDIMPCVRALNALVLTPSRRLRSVHTKYASRKYGEVSKLPGIKALAQSEEDEEEGSGEKH